MKRFLSGKAGFWGSVAVVLIGVGLIAAVQRYATGLGETTNLNDTFPWGLWVGFDILVGVGLAAGGFTVAGAVYILNLERFRPILRPSILTAFLGYLLVIAGLLVDLGKPWAIWHALIYWNPTSVMFEVAWCVMLYTTVLALEFSPIVLERFNMQAPLKVIRAITIPLVAAGVLLSTLHQSSLGSLFLIVPERMHPLWYSNVLPFLFLISCIAAGLSMTIVESYFSSRAFDRKIELPLLTDMARVIVVVLALYVTVRFQDLLGRDAIGRAFEPTYQSLFFWGELTLGSILPFIALLFTKVRKSERGLFYSALLVLFGFVANRLNTAITSMERWPDHVYFPSWQEVAVTVGLSALGFVAFSYAAKFLPVFGNEKSAKLSDRLRTEARRTSAVNPLVRPEV